MMRQGILFKFLLTILRGRTDPTLFYQSLEPQKYRGEETDYLNFGDWHDRPLSYRMAAEALAVRLVTFADLSTATKGRRKTIDVGFGFGEQDVLWAKRFDLEIIGVNLTSFQIQPAAERVSSAGLAGQIRYLQADATGLPIRSGSTDLVVALESAFHFADRQDFLSEAFRVLQSGGKLATADFVVEGHRESRFSLWSLLQRLFIGAARRYAQIPVANLYGREVYDTLLQEIGFVESLIQPIGQDVFQGFCQHIASKAYLARYPLIVQPFFALGARCLRLAYERKWIDYVLVRAAKP
jgi:ubiquinone/menaquinone biosynthesis C-methylase UbiE